MRVAYKIWLDNNGKAFGEGPYRLLKGVERTGSLHQAALQIGMSYRKAWLMLRSSEQRLGSPLLQRTVGGASGGGSQLTPFGRELMKHYRQFREEIEQVLEGIYRKHFGSGPT